MSLGFCCMTPSEDFLKNTESDKDQHKIGWIWIIIVDGKILVKWLQFQCLK